jgi:hypothetical protein
MHSATVCDAWRKCVRSLISMTVCPLSPSSYLWSCHRYLAIFNLRGGANSSFGAKEWSQKLDFGTVVKLAVDFPIPVYGVSHRLVVVYRSVMWETYQTPFSVLRGETTFLFSVLKSSFLSYSWVAVDFLLRPTDSELLEQKSGKTQGW